MEKMEAVLKGTLDIVEEDLDLVEECKLGDRAAFTQLMQKYQNKIFGLAFRMLHNGEEAKDITQDVFFSVYRSIKKFKGESKISTWLYRIAINACINRLKSKGRKDTVPLENKKQEGDLVAINEDNLISGRIDTPSEALERKNLNSILEREIGKLPDEYRVVLVMRDVEGLTYEEIEKILKVPDGTVKSRLHRARMELKKKLSKIL